MSNKRLSSRRQFLGQVGAAVGAGVGIALVPAGFAEAASRAGPPSTPGNNGGGLAEPRDPGQFTYPGDPGFVATSPGELAAAIASWETPEYGFFTGIDPAIGGTTVNAAWQLFAVSASTAYALGYCGQGVTLGIYDSGYRATHEEFQTPLISSVEEMGVYATTGFSYRIAATPANPFTAGEPFTVAGDMARTIDYSHGTGMLGIVSAKRDNISMHGIAFGSAIHAAKTGGSDNMSHGPFHDYVYFSTAETALCSAGAQAINESWGQFVETLDRTRFDGLANDLGVNGNIANAYQITGRDSTSATVNAAVLPNEFMRDLEYQFFIFKKFYSADGEQYNPNHPGQSFMDAIFDAVRATGTVDVRSAGNNDWSNPYFRPAYPLFRPEAEIQWIAVGGVEPPTAANPEYTKQFAFNEAGLAKWWCVSTPSNSVLTTSSASDTSYSLSSGTSPATPVATSCMGVLLSRYPSMDAIQVRELLLTTCNNKMTDGVRFLGTGQTSPTGASIAWTAPDGLPDDRWGWGMPDLAKGMYGPGQFLSPMVYNMSKAPVDVWSNDISQIAIKEREKEDLQWLEGYRRQGVAFAGEFSPNVLNPDGSVSPQAFVLQGILDDANIQALTDGHPELYDKIPHADAVKWRKDWMDARAAYIQSKIAKKLYTASLVKQGTGTLFMSGNNTYEGGSTVEGGKLSVNGSQAGSVTVKGGTLGGTGSVAGSIDVQSGVLQPGLSSKEAASALTVNLVELAPGNVLNVGGGVTISNTGSLAITISGDHDNTSVRARGALELDGELALNVSGSLTVGTVLTIMSGRSVKGHFRSLPDGKVLSAGGNAFRVSYQDGDVTLTVG